MISRLALLALLLGMEVLAATVAFDGATLPPAAGALSGLLKEWAPWGLRWLVASALAFAGMAWMQGKLVRSADGAAWVRWPWLMAHLPVTIGFFLVSRALYGGAATGDLAVAGWLLLAMGTGLTAALSFIPFDIWIEWRRLTGPLWWMAAAAGALACAVGALSRLLWAPATKGTFTLVTFLAGSLTDQLVLQPERSRVGTDRFTVIVSPECSGLEGMGLFLVFSILWLAVFRDELRFPQALALIPAGLAASYLLNAVRIFALLAVGHAGWPEIAARGFHSQAGWIAFCTLAFGLLMLSRRVAWFSKHPPAAGGSTSAEYPAAPYLAPFMALMASGILSQALTAHFEWFYPLRLAATAGTLAWFARSYRNLDWRFGPWAIGAGVSVFLLWIAGDTTPATGPPAELAAAGPLARWAWIAARVAGAVVTVPIAEELAFRGFGLRRLVDEDFERVPWRSWTVLALGVSSAVFGLMHGSFWLAGIAAGLIYAGVAIRQERLGEAIGAHACTNALLAAYVLVTGKWGLW